MKKYLYLCLLTLSSLSSNGQVTTYLNQPYHVVDTVDQNLLSFDAYVPLVQGPKPIVFYVHGGGWVTGDKSVFGDKMRFFTDQGYIFVSINYRLSPFPYELDNPDRVKYPQHPDDVARAVSYILDRHMNFEIDLDRVAIIGHSAGAQIVSLIMTDKSFLEMYGHSPADLKCLCSLDTGGYDINLWLNAATPETTELYTNAFSADSLVRRQASPAINVARSDNLPSTLLVHQSTFKRIAINSIFADSLIKYGGAVKVISTDYDHGEINQKIGDLSDDKSTAYTQEIGRWLLTCMSGSVSTTETTLPDINVFPNPVSEIIYLSKRSQYELTDLGGKTVLRGEGKQVDVSRTSPGMYLLRLRIQDSEFRQLIVIN